MEVGSDSSPFSVGGVHRALYQALPLALPLAHAPGQLPGEGKQPHLEQDQAAQHAGQQAEQQPAAALGDALILDALLEQQSLPVRRVDPEVDLEELAKAAFEPVLGPRWVAQVG